MSFSEMLNHTCDIYHMQRSDDSPGFGLPSSPSFSYPDNPDHKGVACHFHLKNRTERVIQNQPQAILESRVKLSLPAGTDIRLNDKVVDTGNGLAYTTEIPHSVRDHHTIVWLRRTDQQVPL